MIELPDLTQPFSVCKVYRNQMKTIIFNLRICMLTELPDSFFKFRREDVVYFAKNEFIFKKSVIQASK